MYYEKLITPLNKTQTILHSDSPYQSIRFDRTDHGLALYLGDTIQFVEKEERKYHHALAGVPLLRKKIVHKALILGGGDGLAARTIYEIRPFCLVTMCELDPAMIFICSTFPPMVRLNKGSLVRARIFIGDALDTIKTLPDGGWDVVICDFPDMKMDTMELYSPELFGQVSRVLKKDGIISVYPGGQYMMVLDTLGQDFKDFHNTSINIKTMGSTPIISAKRK